MKKPFILLGVFFLTILVIFSYYYLTYIDELVTEGSAYGFDIGISKNDAFKKAKETYNKKQIFIIHPEDEYGAGPFTPFKFSSQDYEIIRVKTKWKFYYDDAVWDYIQLNFENEKLSSIYRKRQKFELP